MTIRIDWDWTLSINLVIELFPLKNYSMPLINLFPLLFFNKDAILTRKTCFLNFTTYIAEKQTQRYKFGLSQLQCRISSYQLGGRQSSSNLGCRLAITYPLPVQGYVYKKIYNQKSFGYIFFNHKDSVSVF